VTDRDSQTDSDFARWDAIGSVGVLEPVVGARGPGGAGVNGDGWSSDLTRRVRVLIHKLPLDRMARLEIVRELTGYARNRVFAYSPYVDFLNEATEPFT